jgi:hypothetical protein
VNYQWCLLLLLALLASCATNHLHKDVDLSKDATSGVVTLDEGHTTSPIILSNSASTTNIEFGPQTDKSNTDLLVKLDSSKKISDKRGRVTTLIFSPGLVRAVGQIALLREIEQEGIDVHIVSGSGIGAIIAVLFAAGKTPDQMEWFFYRLLGELEGAAPFGSRWSKIVSQHLQREFRDRTIQSLGKTVVLPLYDGHQKEVVYLQNGEIVSLLLSNLRLYGTGARVRYSTAFQWKVFTPTVFYKMGSELVIGMNSVGEEIKLLARNEFLFGVMANLAGKMQRESKELSLYVNLPVDRSFLDSGRRLPEIIRDCRKVSQNSVKKLKQMVLDDKGIYNDAIESEGVR